jgi:hypothetical protein
MVEKPPIDASCGKETSDVRFVATEGDHLPTLWAQPKINRGIAFAGNVKLPVANSGKAAWPLYVERSGTNHRVQRRLIAHLDSARDVIELQINLASK